MFPYDAEVLASFYALYNAAVWPAQAIALALAVAALWLGVAPRRGSGRVIGALLTAGWLWCGLVFHLYHFADLDFMAPVYGWVFVAQAALLAWVSIGRGLDLKFRADACGLAGLAVAVVAVFGLPLISGVTGAGFASARVVGLAPGPTVLFTLGLLMLAEGRRRWLLMVIPLLWCAVAGLSASALGVVEAWALPILGIPAFLLCLGRRRPTP